MKKNLIVQVTFETQVEVDIPDNAEFVSEQRFLETIDELFDMGMDIADTLNDSISVDFGDITKDIIYWRKTHVEAWDESVFIGEAYC